MTDPKPNLIDDLRTLIKSLDEFDPKEGHARQSPVHKNVCKVEWHLTMFGWHVILPTPTKGVNPIEKYGDGGLGSLPTLARTQWTKLLFACDDEKHDEAIESAKRMKDELIKCFNKKLNIEL